jgi:hypothetical protein
MYRRDFSISSLINQPYNKFPHYTTGSGVGGLNQGTRRHQTYKAGTCKTTYYLGKETGGLYIFPCINPPTNLAITGLSVDGQNYGFETLTWDPVSNATSYNIYVNGVLVGNTTATTYTIPLSETTISVTALVGASESEPASLTRIASVINTTGVSTNTNMFNGNPATIGCIWLQNNKIQFNSIAGKTYYFNLSFDHQVGFSLANITLYINNVSQGTQFSRITHSIPGNPDIDVDTHFIFKWISNITGLITIDFSTTQTSLGADSYCIILSN